jgi:hypothetical protein
MTERLRDEGTRRLVEYVAVLNEAKNEKICY